MTKSAARRAIAGGCKARVFSQAAPTNLKSLPHKPTTGVTFGAGLFIFGNADASAETKPIHKPPWITGR